MGEWGSVSQRRLHRKGKKLVVIPDEKKEEPVKSSIDMKSALDRLKSMEPIDLMLNAQKLQEKICIANIELLQGEIRALTLIIEGKMLLVAETEKSLTKTRERIVELLEVKATEKA